MVMQLGIPVVVQMVRYRNGKRNQGTIGEEVSAASSGGTCVGA